MAASISFRTAYEQYHRSPNHAPRTHEKFGKLIEYVEQFCLERHGRLLDCDEFDNATMHELRSWLLARMKGTTLNSYRGHLHAVFATIGPACHGNPEGLGLIDNTPRMKKAKEKRRKPRAATLDEVSQIYEACDDDWLKWPHVGLSCTAWWRALIVLCYNIGLRREEFRTLRWSDVSLSRRVLHLDPGKGDSETVVMLLHQTACDHLERIGGNHRLVFPMSARTMDVPAANKPKQLYDWFYKIQERAGIEQRYCFHELRKTCGSALWKTSPGAAQAIMRHSSMETTRKHYADIDDAVAEIAANLEQPAAFVRGGKPTFRVVG